MAGPVVTSASDCPVHWVMLAGCRLAGSSLPRGRWRWWARRVCGAGSRRTRAPILTRSSPTATTSRSRPDARRTTGCPFGRIRQGAPATLARSQCRGIGRPRSPGRRFPIVVPLIGGLIEQLQVIRDAALDEPRARPRRVAFRTGPAAHPGGQGQSHGERRRPPPRAPPRASARASIAASHHRPIVTTGSPQSDRAPSPASSALHHVATLGSRSRSPIWWTTGTFTPHGGRRVL
jgi:hypothetical protein